MCTIALLYRLVPDFPIVLAANRDEWTDRSGVAPSELEPQIWAGRDPRGQGTWLGLNGLPRIVVVANRPTPGVLRRDARSRGLLCVDMLRTATRTHADLRHLIEQEVNVQSYNGFNLLVADAAGALVATQADGKLEFSALGAGLHVIGNVRPGDGDSPKMERAKSHLASPTDLGDAQRMLVGVCGDHGERPDRSDAICVHGDEYATLSSTLIAIHADGLSRSRYLYADGTPCQAEYRDYSGLLQSS